MHETEVHPLAVEAKALALRLAKAESQLARTVRRLEQVERRLARSERRRSKLEAKLTAAKRRR